MGTRPNTVLRSWRVSRRLSQDDLARALRQAGDRAGEPNDASKRLVQRWESGATRTCRPVYARALEAVTGHSYEELGFSPRVMPDESGGHDLAFGTDVDGGVPGPAATASPAGSTVAGYSGVWRSRYEYVSSGRGAEFVGLHYVVLMQHGSQLTVRSLPDAASTPGSTLTMTLEVDRSIVTGTWRENTSPEGYYQGAVYHGAIQLLVEPTGHRMAGKWLGFGKNFDVNTGPWELRFETASTSKATLDTYSHPPNR